MKQPTRSKDLARQRALIRSLIERNPFGPEPAAEIMFAPNAGSADRPQPDKPGKIIPFPDLRRQA